MEELKNSMSFELRVWFRSSWLRCRELFEWVGGQSIEAGVVCGILLAIPLVRLITWLWQIILEI